MANSSVTKPTLANCENCGAPAAPDARFCANCGASLGAPAAEERKVATILFADVIGSTDLGEQLDPERLRALLQEYFGAMSRVIEEWGGTVEKYIGDAILAVFGVPTAREDDPIRALNAATEMLATLARLNGGFETRHGVQLAVRIGVNTGEVLAPLGARPAGQFLVSGDPVNVAARLEQAAEASTVLVAERTASAARHAFAFGDAIELKLKGKRDPVVALPLREALAAEERGISLQGRMVGRDRELETLEGLLDEATESGVPRLVLVSGPAGIGKSRLLREFIASAQARHGDLAVYRGRCLAAGHGITFWALGEILRAACRISLDEPSDSAIEKLQRSARDLLTPLDLRESDLAQTVYALATSANLGLPDNPLDTLEPEAVAEAIARAWPRFLSGLAARAPTVALIEDVHWADEQMVDMLRLLAGRARGPLVVVATARPEFVEAHAALGGAEDVSVVALRPLTDRQSDTLVEELLGDGALPSDLLSEVRLKADGNPFFLEEIVQRLIDEGAIARDDGRWRATERAGSIRLPDTVHALLAARIDALPQSEKRLIQEAAVIGRIFWPGPLAIALDGGATADSLRSLERRGLVGARPTSTIEGEIEYAFRHVLIRDVAYASVPKARRARAHAETGRWLEGLAGDRVEEFEELLAYHYGTAVAGEDADLAWADQPEEREQIRRRAFEVLLRAGLAARRRYAVDKALDLHGQALALAADEAEKARALEEQGDDHEALFHMDEAVSSYMDAADAMRSARSDAADVARMAVKAAKATQRWGAFREQPPREAISALLDALEGGDIDDLLRARLLIEQGGMLAGEWTGSRRASLRPDDRAALPRGIALAERGLAIAEREDDVELIKRANDVIQGLAYHAGDYRRYQDAIDGKAALLDRVSAPRDKVDILESLAQKLNEQGRFREALVAAEQAFELALAASPHERMHASFTLMTAARALGEWDRVLEVLPWHVDAAAAEPNVSCPNVRGGPPLGATVLAWRGEIEKARTLVAPDAQAVSRSTLLDPAITARYAALVDEPAIAMSLADRLASDPARSQYADGYDEFMEALLALDRLDDVIRFLPVMRGFSDADATFPYLADRAEAVVALRQGRDAEARPLLDRALVGFEKLEMPFEAAQTRRLLAEVTSGEERSRHLREALATFDRLGARPFADEVRGLRKGGPLETPA